VSSNKVLKCKRYKITGHTRTTFRGMEKIEDSKEVAGMEQA